jgi:hypothetical protein
MILLASEIPYDDEDARVMPKTMSDVNLALMYGAAGVRDDSAASYHSSIGATAGTGRRTT